MRLKSNRSVTSDHFFQDEFARLVQQRKDGVAVFDRNLRYAKVNDRWAEIAGTSVEKLAGQTPKGADADLASLMEPIMKQVIESGVPVLDHEVLVVDPEPSDPPKVSYWVVACYPLRADDGTVQGVGVVIHNSTRQKLKDAAQEERLQFEALLSDLSAAFINVQVAEIDLKIQNRLQKLLEFLDFDRSTIWHVAPDDGLLRITHSCALPGIPHPPAVIQDDVPLWNDMWRRGEIYRISDVDGLPDDQWREKEYCKRLGGIKSVLFIPLQVSGTICGIISFVSYRAKKSWPDLLVHRLRLLSEIIENALERKRADEKIQKALTEIEVLKNRLEAENHYLRDQIELVQKHEQILGQSAAIKKVLLQVEQVASTDSTVLILGETGTGKELIASAIHDISGRKGRTMVKINCAALPASLIEMELFGREKGAYTGASTSQIGRFEAADGSTIFLDEIGELPLELQAKLLRVLQEGQFERLGSTKTIKVDVRVIAATNRNLAKEVGGGKFREDLYYRLNVFPVSAPPCANAGRISPC